jgi:hypothetical protein
VHGYPRVSEDGVGEVGGHAGGQVIAAHDECDGIAVPGKIQRRLAVEFAPPATATGSGPQALPSSFVAAAGALLAVLFMPAQPARPIRLARPAGPAADEAETAEGRRVAETRPHPAAAAR